MIDAREFLRLLKSEGIDFFSGVPDSLLKDFCACLSDNAEGLSNVVAPNEGCAVAMAAGHFLATSKPACVYMQNSGQGNAVNPLLSLVDEEVYNIPLLMLVGWRGQPGKKDEPQHAKQGKLTLKIFDTLGIKYELLGADMELAKAQVKSAAEYMLKTNKPFALVVEKATFKKCEAKIARPECSQIPRRDAIAKVASALSKSDICVATTGHISRELYEFRKFNSLPHDSDFLTVGSMGHASSIALAIALAKPERRVVCLDGDGALLMHAGALATIAACKPKNFKHIVFNNLSHDSVGGQPTCAGATNAAKLALAMGYESAFSVSDEGELEDKIKKFLEAKSPSLLEIKVKRGAREGLMRPLETPAENKKIFMDFLRD